MLMKQTPLMYQLESGAVLKQVVSTKAGLSGAEAQQRVMQYGENKLVKKSGSSPLLKFFGQFKDLMIILLLASAGISFYLDDVRTGGILIFIVIVNAIIGFSQEYKAERIMESLEKLVVAEAKVFRDGQLTTLAASQLVLGDVIYIEEGDSVPADARIIEESELGSNDFALTGESNPVRKFTHAIAEEALIGNQRNMIFMGTTIATGNALCVVTGTGMSTELGRIAGLSQGTKAGLSPLQREMNTLATRITIGTIILGSILIAISLGADLSLKDAFIFAIGIASAMIPQGLPAEVNVALSQAAGALAREHTLVKKLSAVESLGATSIICTDKTGTLTKNEMTVEHILLPHTNLSVSGTGYEAQGSVHSAKGQELSHAELNSLFMFFVCGFFASNARVSAPDDTHATWHCIGDPTEGALVTLARKAGLNTDILSDTYPELREFPFDSVRKRMSSVRFVNNVNTIFTKGAPESVIARCTHMVSREGKVVTLSPAQRKLLLAENDVYAKRAMRNLAYAYRTFDKSMHIQSVTLDEVESKLIYMGMVSIIDPVREEVAAAMEAARGAHIKVSIITGDYAPTAKAIAVRAKLAEHPDDIILVPGEDLPTMSDEKLIELVTRGSVIFARVSPEDKLRIVSLVHSSGHVIAVTGDGINDAPALKSADIGVAMGVTGTDVAKQSAEIVLLDDSFHTLINAIQQGRTIFQNIKKATLACLTSNFGELITVLVSLAGASIFGIPPAITAVQILAVDLIAELFPIAALGWDKPNRSLMSEKPRDPKNHIFNTAAVIDLLITGTIIGILAYGNYLLFANRNGIDPHQFNVTSPLYYAATTLTYVIICLCQYTNILLRRTPERTLSRYMFTNRQLWFALALSFFCVINIVYNPIIQKVFLSRGLGLIDWLFAVASALIFFIVRETLKHTILKARA